MKFKKDEKENKERVEGRVKGALKNLNRQQRLYAFTTAWDGVPIKVKGRKARAVMRKANFFAPGKVYGEIFSDLNEFVEGAEKQVVSKKLISRLEKNLIKKAYAYQGISAKGKHLTPKQKETYERFSEVLKKGLGEAHNEKFNPVFLDWINKILLPDLKESEAEEKTKMMVSFKLLKKS